MLIGIIISFSGWSIIFFPFGFCKFIFENYFWQAIGFYSLILIFFVLKFSSIEIKKYFKFKVSYITLGLIHGLILFFITNLFHYYLPYLIPNYQDSLLRLYSIQNQLPLYFTIPVLILLVIPQEELFWRVFVLQSLNKLIDFNKYKSIIVVFIATLLYTFNHLFGIMPVLVLASFGIGIQWTLLSYKYKNIIPSMVSHITWDLLVFVIFPLR